MRSGLTEGDVKAVFLICVKPCLQIRGRVCAVFNDLAGIVVGVRHDFAINALSALHRQGVTNGEKGLNAVYLHPDLAMFSHGDDQIVGGDLLESGVDGGIPGHIFKGVMRHRTH